MHPAHPAANATQDAQQQEALCHARLLPPGLAADAALGSYPPPQPRLLYRAKPSSGMEHHVPTRHTTPRRTMSFGKNYLHFVQAANSRSIFIQQKTTRISPMSNAHTTPNTACSQQPMFSTKRTTKKRQTSSSLIIHCRHWCRYQGTSRVKSVGKRILYNRWV